MADPTARRWGCYGTTVLQSADGGMTWERAFDVPASCPATSKDVASAMNSREQWLAGEVEVPDAPPEQAVD